MQVVAPGGAVAMQKFIRVGATPLISTPPQAVEVELTQGALIGEARFSVGFDAEGDTGVQWQRKVIGQERFSDIEGATSTELRAEVGLGLDGAEFRAVVSNEAGKVVSDPAVVTVRRSAA